MLEDRHDSLGGGIWVSPEFKIFILDEEHQEFVAKNYAMMGLEPWQAGHEDANYFAMENGWTRVILRAAGEEVFISTCDFTNLRKVLRRLISAKWVMNTQQARLAIDLYDEGPERPASSFQMPLREFLASDAS